MSKVFDGKVSVYPNTQGELILKRDDEGKFSADNAAECYKVMQDLAKKHKMKINKYAVFIPTGGTEPTLLANRWGKPYIALLPKREDGATGNRPKLKKLA